MHIVLLCGHFRPSSCGTGHSKKANQATDEHWADLAQALANQEGEVDAGVLAYVNSLGHQGRAQLVDVATNAKEGLTPTERARAVFLLGQLRWRPAFDPLRKLLHDESAKVRLSTLYALSKIDAPHAVPLLLETIKDLKSGISEQGHALRCLSDIGDEETIKELDMWAEDIKSVELKRLARNTIMQLSLGLKRLKFD